MSVASTSASCLMAISAPSSDDLRKAEGLCAAAPETGYGARSDSLFMSGIGKAISYRLFEPARARRLPTLQLPSRGIRSPALQTSPYLRRPVLDARVLEGAPFQRWIQNVVVGLGACRPKGKRTEACDAGTLTSVLEVYPGRNGANR